MGTSGRRIATLLVACAATALAQSCATLGPPRVEVPCDGRFEALISPVSAGAGIEIVGKLRLDLPRYRVRGLARIAFSPQAGMARIDFRHSSLFGAIEEDVTVLAGDSLAMYDRGTGTYVGNDSSLALVRRETGGNVDGRDMLVALLLAAPRCAEMRSVSIAQSGDAWRLKAVWRDRPIEMKGERGRGIREFKQCLSGGSGCYTITYGEPATTGALSYPRWVRLRRDGGSERVTFELIEIKSDTIDTSIFERGVVVDPS
jgi:hypothetical protein